MGKQTFTVTNEHLMLVRNLHWCRYSDLPEVDTKRPFGNSDVYEQVNEILGVDYPSEKIETLFKELTTVMQIATRTGMFCAGDYSAAAYTTRWEKV